MITEIKTFVFQCDDCKYTDRLELTSPNTLPHGWMCRSVSNSASRARPAVWLLCHSCASREKRNTAPETPK